MQECFSSDTRPLLTIIYQFMDLQLCFKMFILINAAKTLILVMFSFRFLRSFDPVKSFSSFSLLLLRVKVRGCHTLLKPYETNCVL